jgi:hypothetical protein
MKTLITILVAFIFFTQTSSRLEEQKRYIDQYIVKHPREVILLAKVPKKKESVRIKNEHWPEDVEYSYNVLKDGKGKIIFIAQIPFSESGDWHITYSYYFDNNGKLYCFERFTGFFNSGCTDDAAHETIGKYYDEKFKLISQFYRLTDSKNKPLNKNKCVLNYDFKDYKIYKNVDECLRSFNIKL